MPGESKPARGFPTTRWSAVAGARSPDAAERARSWDALVGAYWRPVYKHLRLRWQRSREDAEDLTQAFFERAMSKDFFSDYDPTRARFRTFLRTCLDRVTLNEDKAARRVKRGGGERPLSLDFEGAEDELARTMSERAPGADEVFDREWRRGIFSMAVDALRAECKASGKEPAFAAFERYDLADDAERPTYAELARALGVPATTVTNQLAWARRELRRLALARLEPLTETDDELGHEARALLGDG